jgi:mRNA-degrading endonuclease RelE of RelBE toxin-antitoxin system
VAYAIEIARSVVAQLESLTAYERARVLDAIDTQLGYEPLHETHHRKPLRPNPVAPWELRVGALRVFYEVGTGKAKSVRILAVGKKTGNVLWIAGRKIKL